MRILTHNQSVNYFIENKLHPEFNLPFLINKKGILCKAKQTKQVIRKVLKIYTMHVMQ